MFLILTLSTSIINFNTPAHANIIATGGTITYVGDYIIHTFTSSGTFTISSGTGDVEYLVIGGGGGASIGGGGAGGYLTGTNASMVVGSYTVTIGAGGAGASGGVLVMVQR